MSELHATPYGKPKGQRFTAQDIPWWVRLRVLAFSVLTLVVGTLILVGPMPFTGQVTVEVGDVATSDVAAPRQVTYISDIQTRERRDLAANAVPEAYDAREARIGRQQLTIANRILDYIGTVRGDSNADQSLKVEYLGAITAIQLPADVISRTLSLPTTAWDRVAAEVQRVLEASMREEIRENTLAEERRKVPARIRLDFSDEDTAIVSAMVEGLLVPNAFFNAELTEQQRQIARDRVETVTVTVERGETILRAGDIVTPLDIEALAALGLRQNTWSWQEVRGAVGFLLLLLFVMLYYLWRAEPQLWLKSRDLFMLETVMLLFLLAGRIVIPARESMPYYFPYAALPIILAILINPRVALVSSGLFTLVVGWFSGGGLELIVYSFMASIIGTLKVRKGERLTGYAWASLYVTMANILVILAFRLVSNGADLGRIVELVLASVVNGLLTATVTLVGVFLIGLAFGIVTPLQLMELSRPTHPLLRHLLLKAPGTYHHTLIVSNMAERAVEAIGGNALLTRVGAYYHDVGKTIRPYFFTENQADGVNPHSRLDPYTSAQIIITHVKDGIDLARKYRLPQQVIDFIPEHQGTLLVAYFYHEAVELAGSASKVDESLFHYPGPKPQTKETAVTMLADGAEATVRSKRPATMEELEKIVAASMQSRMAAGELDDCPLTLADLKTIGQVFVDVLRGLHHPRIAYPSGDAITQESQQGSHPAPEALSSVNGEQVNRQSNAGRHDNREADAS